MSTELSIPFAKQQKILEFLEQQQLNILIVGATGAGKSSTINALFDADDAQVGFGSEPLTMDIKQYDLGSLVLWDTPGLGDGLEEDSRHKEKIVHQLTKKDDAGNFIIDLVLVIIDGSSREMSTSYELINEVVIPNLGTKPDKRILVAINQADIAFKGKNGWNYENNMPTEIGYQFLDGKVDNVKQRIQKSTGINTDPMYYCAGYQGQDGPQPPFNLSKLLYMIVNRAPNEKRLAICDNISKETDRWKSSDGRTDYNRSTRESFGMFKIITSVISGFFGLFG